MNVVLALAAVWMFSAAPLSAAEAGVQAPRRFALSLESGDVLPTGNEWVALPTIRASDGALESFNALSMKDRGLLEVVGDGGKPALEPYFKADGKPFAFKDPSWELVEYWIPAARLAADGLEATLTWCAPPGARAAFAHLTLTNRRKVPVAAVLGLKASWGGLRRVTYLPVALRGERTAAPALWMDSGESFSYITDDTRFAWALVHPGSESRIDLPPQTVAPEAEAWREAKLAPGETVQADYIFGVGLEEFSAPHSAKALRERIDREGADAVIAQAATWARERTRTTGQADLDMVMNRNFLFTAMYAWGRTIDTEQLVGVTSRSPRYYVSAAYWDRDAMLWSFPGLLDVDKDLAREALEHALTVQLRNAGTHSRFIDGAVLEDGFQLDEAVAPLLALSAYVRKTGDEAFLAEHRKALDLLRDRLLSRFDPSTGLFSTLQDSQDEYQKQAFLTYDNALSWKTLGELSGLYERLKEPAAAKDLEGRAAALRLAVLEKEVFAGAPDAPGTILACGTDGKSPLFTDVPPGSLMRLPTLGFLPEDDPVFRRTYDWLHSKGYKYSYSDQPYGLPGSYRLPITTSWSVADHLGLARGREQALKILRKTRWDGGIVSEGMDPKTALLDQPGRAFATAAGYVAHAICEAFCTDQARASR